MINGVFISMLSIYLAVIRTELQPVNNSQSLPVGFDFNANQSSRTDSVYQSTFATEQQQQTPPNAAGYQDLSIAPADNQFQNNNNQFQTGAYVSAAAGQFQTGAYVSVDNVSPAPLYNSVPRDDAAANDYVPIDQHGAIQGNNQFSDNHYVPIGSNHQEW